MGGSKAKGAGLKALLVFVAAEVARSFSEDLMLDECRFWKYRKVQTFARQVPLAQISFDIIEHKPCR